MSFIEKEDTFAAFIAYFGHVINENDIIFSPKSVDNLWNK